MARKNVALAKKAAEQQGVGPFKKRGVVGRKRKRHAWGRVNRGNTVPRSAGVARNVGRTIVLTGAAPVAEAAVNHNEIRIFGADRDAGLAAVFKVHIIHVDEPDQVEGWSDVLRDC